MENRIPEKTLLKIFDLIQRTGVEEDKVLWVRKFFDPNAGKKILQNYIQKGVVGDLDLSKNTNIKSLPEGLKCRILNLWENKTLKELPKMEAKKIWASHTNIQTIRDGLKCNYLDLEGNKTLKHLPKIQADEIVASSTNIQTIEEGLKCKELSLWGNKTLKHLPTMEAENIIARNTNIQTIGDGLKCELLDLERNTSLKAFPKNLKVEKLDLRNTHFSKTYTEEEIRKKIEIDGKGKVGRIIL